MVRGGPLTAREGGPKLTNPSTCSVCKGARDIDSRPPLPPTSCATCTREYNMDESWRWFSSLLRVHGPSVRRLARLDERHTERSSAWSSIVPRKRLW